MRLRQAIRGKTKIGQRMSWAVTLLDDFRNSSWAGNLQRKRGRWWGQLRRHLYEKTPEILQHIIIGIGAVEEKYSCFDRGTFIPTVKGNSYFNKLTRMFLSCWLRTVWALIFNKRHALPFFQCSDRCWCLTTPMPNIVLYTERSVMLWNPMFNQLIRLLKS